MIKKITLATAATLALITLNLQAEGMKCQAGKCGSGMMKQAKQGAKMHKMGKKKMSPFLIKHGLPHLTKMLMKNWNDAKLALTAEQKEKLTAVRETTMGGLMKLKPEVKALTQEIIQASKSGTKAAELKSKVEKLASLEAEATMVHLNCIENTKAVLKPEQLQYLMEKRKAMHTMKKGKMQGMKCAGSK